MSEFDSIRPYNDSEVPEVVERVVSHPELARAASRLVMPEALHDTVLGEWITRTVLRHKTRGLKSVGDCQRLLAGYFEDLVEQTTVSVTTSGMETLDPASCYLFMSNHRDIVMDSSLLNFLIHRAGHHTCRMAVGDNLLKNSLAADLMRLNKSFVVQRQVKGKALLRVVNRTSSYIRKSLEEGVSIWIAQREGRAKDGWDRTDPALLKMLAMAHRDAECPLTALVERFTLVPVSVSYELDPCALRKAHELYVTEQQGQYVKTDLEDLESIIRGLVGHKGRVHLQFNAPVRGAFKEPEDLAVEIDRGIVRGLRVFPTHVLAAQTLGDAGVPTADVDADDSVMARYQADLDQCPEEERSHLLLQYANLVRNRHACCAGQGM